MERTTVTALKTHTLTFGSDTARILFSLGVALLPFGVLNGLGVVAMAWPMPFPVGAIFVASLFLMSLAVLYWVYEMVMAWLGQGEQTA